MSKQEDISHEQMEHLVARYDGLSQAIADEQLPAHKELLGKGLRILAAGISEFAIAHSEGLRAITDEEAVEKSNAMLRENIDILGEEVVKRAIADTLRKMQIAKRVVALSAKVELVKADENEVAQVLEVKESVAPIKDQASEEADATVETTDPIIEAPSEASENAQDSTERVHTLRTAVYRDKESGRPHTVGFGTRPDKRCYILDQTPRANNRSQLVPELSLAERRLKALKLIVESGDEGISSYDYFIKVVGREPDTEGADEANTLFKTVRSFLKELKYNRSPLIERFGHGRYRVAKGFVLSIYELEDSRISEEKLREKAKNRMTKKKDHKSLETNVDKDKTKTKTSVADTSLPEAEEQQLSHSAELNYSEDALLSSEQIKLLPSMLEAYVLLSRIHSNPESHAVESIEIENALSNLRSKVEESLQGSFKELADEECDGAIKRLQEKLLLFSNATDEADQDIEAILDYMIARNDPRLLALQVMMDNSPAKNLYSILNKNPQRDTAVRKDLGSSSESYTDDSQDASDKYKAFSLGLTEKLNCIKKDILAAFASGTECISINQARNILSLTAKDLDNFSELHRQSFGKGARQTTVEHIVDYVIETYLQENNAKNGKYKRAAKDVRSKFVELIRRELEKGNQAKAS